MKERIPFLVLTVLSVVDVLFAAAVLPDISIWALAWGGLLQLIGAMVIGFSNKIPATASVTPLVVGATLIVFDSGWRELYAHGALIWIPVATAVATINLVSLSRRPRQVAVGAVGLIGWIIVAAAVMGLEGHSVVTALLAATAPILSGACISLYLRLRRAQHDRLQQAQRERTLAVDRARAAERQRLAEELHDTVTHRVTLLVMQANVLAATADDRVTRTAAESIALSGRTALEELRDFLGLLTQSSPSDSTGSLLRPNNNPEPRTDVSSGDVEELIKTSQDLQSGVEYVEHGSADRAPEVVARTVYRLVQEGLTNVHKHAPDARARVNLTHGLDDVKVEIWNSASAESPVADTGSGSGLAALRRRVQLLGGRFEAAREEAGGFSMTAQIPYRKDPAPNEES